MIRRTCIAWAWTLALGLTGAASAQLVALETFDALPNGTIDEVQSSGAWQHHGGLWHTSNRQTGGVRVIADPTADARPNNKVLAVVGLPDGSARRSGGLGRDSRSSGAESRIDPQQTGTLFFRIHARGTNPNAAIGFSARDVAARGLINGLDVDALAAGVVLQASDEPGMVDLVRLDGQTVLHSFPADQWRQVWLVIRRSTDEPDGAADRLDVHVNAGGPAGEADRVAHDLPLDHPVGFELKSILLIGRDGVAERAAVLFDDLHWHGEAASLDDPVPSAQPGPMADPEATP
jgi:hypothetical protein